MFQFNISMISDGINVNNKGTFLPRGQGLFGIDFLGLAQSQPSLWGFLLQDDASATLSISQKMQIKRTVENANDNNQQQTTQQIQQIARL